MPDNNLVNIQTYFLFLSLLSFFACTYLFVICHTPPHANQHFVVGASVPINRIYVSMYVQACHTLSTIQAPKRPWWDLAPMQGDDNSPVQKHTYMPITLSILRIVLQQTFTVCASEYLAYLFKAMCTTAFFCLFTCWGNHLLPSVNDRASDC